jgi:predicted dehydrogenase
MLYGSEGSVSKREGALDGWKLVNDEDGSQEAQMLESFGLKADKKSGSADPLAVSFDGHTQIILDLMDAIREGRDPHISLGSARHAVEIINAIYESGRTGKEVTLGKGA